MLKKDIDDLAFSLKDIVWAVGYKDGEFKIIPFVFNYDNTEIMDINNLARYVVDKRNAKNVIVSAVSSKYDGMEVREIVYGIDIEKSVDYENFKAKNPHLLVHPSRVEEWFNSLIMSPKQIMGYAKSCTGYVNEKFQRQLNAKKSRFFGMKDKSALKLPYTDFSTQFEFNDVYFAIIKYNHSGDSVVPFVVIEDELGYRELIKQLLFGEKINITNYGADLEKRIKMGVDKTCSGIGYCTEIIKGVDIEKRYPLLIDKNAKDYDKEVESLSTRKYDRKGLTEIAKLYTNIVRQNAKSNQTSLDRYM